MKRTNLSVVYNLGKNLATLDKVSADMKMSDAVLELVTPRVYLHEFLEQTKGMPLPESRAAAERLFSCIDGMLKSASGDWKREITLEESVGLSNGRESLERQFEDESKRILVFTVLPKGIYDTAILISTPEQKFPEAIRALLPPQMLYDLKQAALCLAFDIPTACAFHVCRGTEAVMLRYYELLAKHPWSFKKKDWKIYIEQLAKEKAPLQITNRLDEIRALDRNTYIHPDVNISLEEAPILFELCTGVIFLMGQEMVKLTT